VIERFRACNSGAHLLRGEDEYEAEQMIDHQLAGQLDHAKSK